MTDQNNDNQFDEFRSDDFPAEEPAEETAPAASGGGNNRNFMIGIGVIAAILVLALIGMGVYAATVLPQSRARQAALAQTVQAENEAAAQLATQQAFVALQAQITPSVTPLPPTATLAPSRTPVVAVSTAEPTLKPGENKAETPDATALAAGTQAAGTTPLAGGAARTATLAVLLTQAAANQQQASSTGVTVAAGATATALPNTGFADEVGLPGLFGLALGLIILILLSRTLRLSSR